MQFAKFTVSHYIVNSNCYIVVFQRKLQERATKTNVVKIENSKCYLYIKEHVINIFHGNKVAINNNPVTF